MKFFFVFIGKFLSLLFYAFIIKVEKIQKAIITGFYSRGMQCNSNYISLDYPVNRIIGQCYIRIENNTSIGKRATITAFKKRGNQYFDPYIYIGENVAIGDDIHITAINKISIGKGVLIGKKVTITDNAHGMNITNSELNLSPIERNLYSKGAVIIEDNVWIGDKATICPGVNIGKGSIIGANSVVTKSIPCHSIAAGVPAKVLKSIC